MKFTQSVPFLVTVLESLYLENFDCLCEILNSPMVEEGGCSLMNSDQGKNVDHLVYCLAL